MTQIKNPITIILIVFFFFITTCTTDNSITGNSNQAISKAAGTIDITTGDKELDPTQLYINKLIGWIAQQFAEAWMYGAAYEGCAYTMGDYEDENEKQYDFRDNFLSKSEKGEVYTACYYLLSKYGIENNLINTYYKEHFELLKIGTSVAYSLQYGSSNDKILINRATSVALKDMLKVYRNSLNHKEIEPVLQYLEVDLEKYYNKPKYEIAADFK